MPPGVVFLAVSDIAVGAQGMAEILAPEITVGIQFLGVADGDGVTGFGSVEAETEPSGKVLPEIHDNG